MEDKQNIISIDRTGKECKGSLLKNYIISNNRKAPEYVELNESFIFDGITFGVCIKGSGILKVNHKEYEVTANKILCIMPDNICKMIKESDDFLLELMFFSQDYISSFSLPFEKDIIVDMAENPVIEISEKMMQDRKSVV